MTGVFQFLAGRRGFAALSLIICITVLEAVQGAPASNPTNAPIPFAELGARAGAQYQGDGLSVLPKCEGARLRCDFHRLEGEAMAEGLWLISTADGTKRDRFRIVARSVRRVANSREENLGAPASRRRVAVASCEKLAGETPALPGALAHTGTVAVVEKVARFVRPGLVEEYSVSVDGVRQDFIIEQRPAGAGKLRVELEVAGAKLEPVANGAQLVLENSGRTIAYSRLRVTDATGKKLTARMEVPSPPSGERVRVRGQARGLKSCSLSCDVSEQASLVMNRNIKRTVPPLTPTRSPLRGVEGEPSAVSGAKDAVSASRASMLAVVVEDADAVYPVRIDPMFSDENWISMGGIPGADSFVNAAVVDGSGNLYIGGTFAIAGDVLASRIAKWNGTNWTALGSGMNGGVTALAVSGSDLYAGGSFTTAGDSAANNIAKWNGSSWTALGSGMGGVSPGSVSALAVLGTDLYAGGLFTTAGGSPANYIAKWDGTNWTGLGPGMNAAVSALAVSGSDVYAGGYFSNAGGATAKLIAKWNGSSWSPLGSGLSGYYDIFSNTRPYVSALAISGTDLYVGGSFTNAGGNAATNIAKWNESSWTALGSGMNGPVSALEISGSDVYAGGFFTTAGGSAATNIAKWNGSSWTALGSGLTGVVSALVVSSTDLYVGGAFSTASAKVSGYIAKWNGSSWKVLGSGLNDALYALAVSGNDLYVGGGFTMAGDSNANNVAKWNGSSWTALGSGVSGVSGYQYQGVKALAVSGSDLYAGGTFTTAGGSVANYIAKWDGSNWTTLGSGMNGAVFALVVSGNDLYAGGGFTTAGGSAANNIAKWDGSSWSALGSGLNNAVLALVVSGSDLYAGGNFSTAGGSAASDIAKWNGSSWSALGEGLGGNYPSVYALAVSGSDVYAGGDFTTAGGNAVNYIAKWDGSRWSALGSGMNVNVRALAVSGSDLYAGGYFTTVGGSAANFIAKWDGTSWTGLGSGMGAAFPYNPVKALAVSGSDLYVGGDFTTAGGKVSAYLAKADLLLAGETAPTLTLTRASNNTMLVLWPSSFTNFTLQQNLDLNTTNWMTPSETVNAINSVNYIIVDPPSGNRFYRLFKP